MKNIIKICIFIFIGLNYTYAQEDEIVKVQEVGHYDEDVNKYYYYKDIDGVLNKFLGDWRYAENGKLLEVTFYLKLKRYAGGDFVDEIYAKFKYTENGNVIYDTTNDNSSHNERIIRGSYFFRNNLNKMSLSYNEPTDIVYNGRSPSLEIEHIGCRRFGCTPKLKWYINYGIPICPDCSQEIWPFKIPNNIELIKQ